MTAGWLQRSVRNKLLAMALGPLLVVLPLLVIALLVWGNAAYDRLLITKVRSDLAVARGYFDQVRGEVGSGTQAMADSHALQRALAAGDRARLAALLGEARQRLGFDFLNLYSAQGGLLGARRPGAATDALSPATAAGLPRPTRDSAADLAVLEAPTLLAMAPQLAPRLQIALIPTPGAAPTAQQTEQRALTMIGTRTVVDDTGRTVAVLRGGLLLNQNLALIDHINRIVYPEGALPFHSQGTATLFLDDVRVTTNVRLFPDRRAIGTRVSQAVRDAVLTRGNTWLDRAFVVNDWYVSAYDPLRDHAGRRVGMLYVGYLEQPFRWAQYAMLALIGALFALVMALAAVASLRWARSIFRPVEQMNQAMQRVEDGDSRARVGTVAAQDELGALARHLDRLLDAVDDKTRALQRWGSALDQQVAERTRELAQRNDELQQAQRQLVRSEKLAAIGQLTASIAHEINNPIAVIQGNLDLMRETLGPHALPVHDELRLLDEQVERMRRIVNQLLQHARPTEYAGYVEPLDVQRVLDDCLLLVAHLLAQTHIRVVRELHATAPAAMNRQELQQVLINLLVNAIQAMPDGGTLTLRSADRDPARGAPGPVVSVLDTGPGLDAQLIGQLFSPFVTTKREGTGLGLWISQGLVERYGGSLAAANREDGHRGACFTVQLYSEPQEPPAAALTPADRSPEPPR